MHELVRRVFPVDAGLDEAWRHLSEVEAWPSWAKHIKRVTLDPPGPLTEKSTGAFTLTGGVRSTFRMESFDPPHAWQWVGRFLTVEVHYDHRFVPIDADHTELDWTVRAQGIGEGSLALPFGAIYARNLDRAIPNLQAELHHDG